jgi:hypothetical protein
MVPTPHTENMADVKTNRKKLTSCQKQAQNALYTIVIVTVIAPNAQEYKHLIFECRPWKVHGLGVAEYEFLYVGHSVVTESNYALTPIRMRNVS